MFRNQIGDLVPRMGCDIWVQILKRRLREEYPNNKVVVCDVRFPNEIRGLEGEGAMIVCVRSNIESNKFGDHVSENALDGMAFEHVIENTGTLDELYVKVLILKFYY